jgi:hypothetical protein
VYYGFWEENAENDIEFEEAKEVCRRYDTESATSGIPTQKYTSLLINFIIEQCKKEAELAD